MVVSARSTESHASLIEEIRDTSGEVTALPADVSEFEQVRAVADGAVKEYGRLGTWVRLSAVILFAAFEGTAPEAFQQVTDVNPMGQVYGRWRRCPTSGARDAESSCMSPRWARHSILL